ncbi:hypothetical protein GGR54DRAFT_591722 [Hypoxylon sp. NC1633]|nr:hypothetical protein GGR54DRAFT_591722 [Hypoxylon sp. NC1633]
MALGPGSGSERRLEGTPTTPSLTSHGSEKPRPLAVSESVSSASDVVLWPRSSASQPRAVAAAMSRWRISRRWTSAREVAEGRRVRMSRRRCGGGSEASCGGRDVQSMVGRLSAELRGMVTRSASGKWMRYGDSASSAVVGVGVEIANDCDCEDDGSVEEAGGDTEDEGGEEVSSTTCTAIYSFRAVFWPRSRCSRTFSVSTCRSAVDEGPQDSPIM